MSAQRSAQQDADRQFEDYLRDRAAYYRVEQRWPNSPFWQRRHQLLPTETPIWLDPEQRLVATTKTICDAQTILDGGYLRHVDAALLIHFTRKMISAKRVVTRYQQVHDPNVRAQDVIVAIQMLLKSTVLNRRESQVLG